MLQPPDGGTRLELSSFARPDHLPGSPAAPANELGLRNVAFEVHDLQAAVDRAATDGYRLVGGIGDTRALAALASKARGDYRLAGRAHRLSLGSQTGSQSQRGAEHGAPEAVVTWRAGLTWGGYARGSYSRERNGQPCSSQARTAR